MPIVAFMQHMHNQMQTFMQQMHVQMQSQMLVQPALGSTSGSLQNRLDERCFRRLDRFSNKCDDWKECRLHFLTVIGECNAKFSTFLKENERKEDIVDTDLDISLEFVELSAQLQLRLINLTTKTALGIVESTQTNGCEACRLLS